MAPNTVSHYQLISKLGAGGMGVVYKARDTKLDRHVALKFLPQELIRDEEIKNRFISEAKAASALQHNNICTIHEIDQARDGRMFICMDFYEGGTLEDKITGGPLSIEDAKNIIAQMASGLSAAHKKGIIHQDIKPANIFITTNNEVKILDFGIAKSGSQDSDNIQDLMAGTTSYMSPEQVRGEEVDHRTDIWSLGVVFYYILSGELPFQGDYEQAVFYAIINENPESLGSFREDIPPNFIEIVNTCLNTDRDNRFHKVFDIIKLLDKKIDKKEKTKTLKKSIIVLPFENISPENDNEYFSDGLMEEIITDLSNIHDLRVITRQSAMSLKGTDKSIKSLGSELDLDYAISGSVRKAGNQLRITAKLFNAKTEEHMWAEKYRGTLEDVFDIEEQVSDSIVKALRLKLSPSVKRKLSEHPIQNARAYESFLKARPALYSFDEADLKKAEKEIRNAIEIVGESEILFGTLGWIYERLSVVGTQSDENYIHIADEYVRKIFFLNPNSFYGFSLEGLIHHFRGNIQEAVRDLKRACAIDENNPDILQMLSFNYLQVGKGNIARQLVVKLLEIDPLTAMTYSIGGFLECTENNFALGLQYHQKMYEMNPVSPASRLFFAWTLALNRRNEEAVVILDHVLEDTPDTIFGQLCLFMKHSIQGNPVQALQIVSRDLENSAKKVEFQSRLFAEFYANLDVREEAMDWLENCVSLGFINYPYLWEYNPLLKNIRAEKRFKSLMKKVKQKWEKFEV